MFAINQYRTQLHTYFAEQAPIILAYLFGSYARGKPHAHSDIDIAVLHSRDLDKDASFDLRLDLIGDLMGLLHTNDVDVIILNQAPLALSYRVLRDGILLFSHDEQTRILYQADIVSRYLDFKPFIDYQDQATLARARRGELSDGYNPHHGALAHYRQLREKSARIPNDDA